jgi:LemA protein
MWVLWVVLGLVALSVIFGIVGYNRFVAQRQLIKDSWANIDTELRRRYDLIPNLVETVRGYASHEREIFTEVANARSRLLAARTPAEAEAADGALTSALGRLLAISEAYPQLKANENFIRLQDELAGTENRIAVERKRFNDSVAAHNVLIKRFPTNIVAGITGFEARQYFQASKESQEVPRVDFERERGKPAVTP